MHFRPIRCVAAVLALAATACGGGSGGSNGGGGAGGTSNRPPSFTSGSTFSFPETRGQTENRTIVQLTANDPDGNPLTFEIVAGKDAARFVFLGQEGALTFGGPVSFETPSDGNGDNVYEVDVRVSDGTASATQIVRVTVTNSYEGLVVTQIGSALGTLGSIAYLDDINQVLVVDRDGAIARVNPTTRAVVMATFPANIPTGADVIDIMADDFGFRAGNFFILANNGTRLYLLYVDSANGDSAMLWTYQAPQPVTGSLGRRGDRVLVATSDAGAPAAAQDPADLRGKILEMHNNGLHMDRDNYSVEPQVVGWGLRDPRLPLSDSIQEWQIDRGETFNEVNQGGFPISQSMANFEWPLRDGLTERAFTGPITGTRVAPRIVQRIGANGAGRWLDAASGLQGLGWLGVWVIPDDQGNVWTWDSGNNGPLELRNLDFGIATPQATRAFVSVDEGDGDVGRARPIFLLSADGDLFMADLQN